MLKRLLRQHNIPWIGQLKDMAVMTMFYVGILNTLMIAITAYGTTMRPFLLLHMPWFKLWMLIALVVIVALVGMLLEYLLVYASYFSFRNKQEFEHENLVRKEIEGLRQDIANLRKQKGDG